MSHLSEVRAALEKVIDSCYHTSSNATILKPTHEETLLEAGRTLTHLAEAEVELGKGPTINDELRCRVEALEGEVMRLRAENTQLINALGKFVDWKNLSELEKAALQSPGEGRGM